MTSPSFQVVAETTLALERKDPPGCIADFLKFGSPFLDTYRTMCLAPQPEFRQLLEQVRDLPIAA